VLEAFQKPCINSYLCESMYVKENHYDDKTHRPTEGADSLNARHAFQLILEHPYAQKSTAWANSGVWTMDRTISLVRHRVLAAELTATLTDKELPADLRRLITAWLGVWG
jgi:hypothetical protein